MSNNQCYPPCDYGCFLYNPSNFKNCFVFFEGYLLDLSSFKCLPDLKCNTNSNCTICPLRYVACNGGYEYLDLKGTCIRKERVEISVKLDVEFDEMGGKLTDIRKGLLRLIGNSYVDQDEYLIVGSMK